MTSLRAERSGGIEVWTIDRPESKNALNFTTLAELEETIAKAACDRALRAVILTGTGNVFVSGGDLRELRDATSEEDAARFAEAGRSVCDALRRLRVPVIAAINGHAIGGGAELAVACDLRIADEKAKICFKQVRMGVTTAWGTFPRLVGLVGPSSAARLLYTAHEIRAMEARALGLVDYVADAGASVATAMAWALDVVQGAPEAIAQMKELFEDFSATHGAARDAERKAFVATWSGAEHREAVEAYFSASKPTWVKGQS